MSRSLVAEDAARDFGKAFGDFGYLLAELRLDVLNGVVGVLHHVVEQRRADRSRSKSYFLAHDASHLDGVHDVGLARAAAYACVRRLGKFKCAFYYLHFLAVIARQIAIEEILICIIYHFLFLLRCEVVLSHRFVVLVLLY